MKRLVMKVARCGYLRLTERDVADEEDGHCNVVVRAAEAEVLHEAFDLGIALYMSAHIDTASTW